MPCDAALVAGECMVNESSLTGHSQPLVCGLLCLLPCHQAPRPRVRLFIRVFFSSCSQLTISASALTNPTPLGPSARGLYSARQGVRDLQRSRPLVSISLLV